MPKVEYSPKALEDLKHLNDYIISNWGEDVAKNVLRKMMSNVRRLELYPLSGVELGKLIDVQSDYRYIFVEKNYVFYRLEDEKVQVVRVLNEHQEYMIQLFGVNSVSNTDNEDDS
jgi:toxin ParE1/3/4